MTHKHEHDSSSNSSTNTADWHSFDGKSVDKEDSGEIVGGKGRIGPTNLHDTIPSEELPAFASCCFSEEDEFRCGCFGTIATALPLHCISPGKDTQGGPSTTLPGDFEAKRGEVTDAVNTA